MSTVLEARMSSSENKVEELKKENAGKMPSCIIISEGSNAACAAIW